MARNSPVLLLLILLQSTWCYSQNIPELRNVVVILSDDHALKVTGAYGNQIVNTPNIDRLSSQGITFNRAYCNAPICSASRQSLLTGKYPHATGVNLLFTPFPDQGNTTIAEHLRSKNYQTAVIGKTHWNNWIWGSLYADGLPDHGFDEIIEQKDYREYLKHNQPPELADDQAYYSREGLSRDSIAEWMNWRVLPHRIDDAHSSGTYFARQAVEFLTRNQQKPFFLWLAFHEPHQPYYFPAEYAGKYDPNQMILPDGSPEDDRWIPMKYLNLNDKQKKGIIASYYTSTEYMDKNIGLVLDALDRLDLAENTLVIYISDNGYLLYEHKRFEKHTMWEEAIRQPTVFRAGKSYSAGKLSDALVEYIDIAPSILELINVEPIAEAQGSSFVPVLAGETTNHREYAFSEYLQDNLAMICSKNWKYVFTTGNRDLGIGYQTGHGPSGIVHRLYDLENDPHETQSVAHLTENQQVLKELQEQMLTRFMSTHPDSSNCPKELTLEGKLVWFCEPRDVGFDQLLEDYPIRVTKP